MNILSGLIFRHVHLHAVGSIEALIHEQTVAQTARFLGVFKEVQEQLETLNLQSKANDNEDFLNFFLKFKGPCSKTTNRYKLERYRDLLSVAVTLDQGDPLWEAVDFGLELMIAMDASAVRLFGHIQQCFISNSFLALSPFSPESFLRIPYEGHVKGKPYEYANIKEHYHGYDEVIMALQAARLDSDFSLIETRKAEISHSSGSYSEVEIYNLSPKGHLLGHVIYRPIVLPDFEHPSEP